MEKTLPAGAAKLLDLIGETEAPRGYDTLYGNNDRRVPKKLTTMTLDEVIAAGLAWTREFGSSACGRYQFVNSTLKSLKRSEGLSGSEVFSPDLQDRLGYALLDRRGFEKFVLGRVSVVRFGLGLAQEWASFPVLVDCQGAHRWVKRGETYYAGDELNRALIGPSAVERVLGQILKTVTRIDILAANGDAAKIGQLIAMASSEAGIRRVHAKVRKIMKGVYGYETLRNGCAATLSTFLRDSGIDVKIHTRAKYIVRAIEARGWERVENGHQRPGDVGVTKDEMAPDGADHVYLVIYKYDADRMMIADNQAPHPHERYVSGRRGRTETAYFLRARGDARGAEILTSDYVSEMNDYPAEDEDTNDMPEPVEGEGDAPADETAASAAHETPARGTRRRRTRAAGVREPAVSRTKA